MLQKLQKSTQVLVIVAAAGLLAWLASAQQPATSKVTPDALINAAGNGAEWLSYGHDYAETHFSPLSQINTKNVKRLSLAWSSVTDAPQGTVEATPLMHDGVLYGILPWDVMFATDARTGQTKWRWDPDVPREHIQGLCCGPVNRGVAIYNGRVYAGLLDGRVVALDQETGKLLWSTQDTVPGGDTILTSAVRVVKGKVIVGSSGAEQAVRGYFSAYDAETGAKVWEEPLLGDRPVSWISYMLDGKQFLAILARSSPNNRLFTFTLDGGGTMPAVPPPAPAQGKGKGAPPPAPAK